MNLFDHSHYSYVRTSLSYIGAWPYDRSHSQILRAVAVAAYLLNFLILQLLRMVTSNFDTKILLDIIPPVIATIVIFIKLITAWLNLTVIKSLLDRMQQHWELFCTEPEIKILEEYAYKTRIMRTVYVALTQGALAVLILQQVSPGFLDKVLPLNQSRPRRHMFELEYFVDRNDYYYPILAHMAFAVQLCIWGLIGTDLPYISSALHACGVSGVVGHKFVTAFDESEHHVCKNGRGCSVLKKLEDCVKSHRMLISYMNTINSCYSNSYAVQCLCAIVALTIICLQLFKAVLVMDVEAGVVYIIQLVAFSLPICYVTIPGQIVLNSSCKLFQTVYCDAIFNTQEPVYMFDLILIPSNHQFSIPTMLCTYKHNIIIYGLLFMWKMRNLRILVAFPTGYCGQWYMSCVQSQRILVVVMRMCHEPLCLFISCCVIMSLETLATVLKAPVSFFMALYSMYS